MTKVTSLKQRLERETTKREKLQEELTQLEEAYASEKKRLTDEHISETQSLKRKWAEEKAILLDVIQRDCNLVFEQNRNTSHTSPKSVVYGFPSLEKQYDASVQVESPTNQSQRQNEEPISTYTLGVSPRYSDIEQELRETEALVQTILGSKPSEEGAAC
jgi:hypothetical protein